MRPRVFDRGFCTAGGFCSTGAVGGGAGAAIAGWVGNRSTVCGVYGTPPPWKRIRIACGRLANVGGGPGHVGFASRLDQFEPLRVGDQGVGRLGSGLMIG